MAGILLFLSIILIPSLSFAAISLNVTPADGSSSLKLEQAYLGLDNKKDVRIRVTSTEGKRYQVFARVLDPIVNEKAKASMFGPFLWQRWRVPIHQGRFISRTRIR